MSKAARIFLAVYDPANPSSSGDYWAWRHPALPKSTADRFYDEAFSRNLPSDISKVGDDDCMGGYAQLQGEWGCWYRIFNGGRDQFHRPGRFVIGCAFMRLKEIQKGNFSQVLKSAQFKEISHIASRGAPLPAPANLEFECDPLPVASSPPSLSAFLAGETVQFKGDEAIDLAGNFIASVPNDLACHCNVVGMGKSISASCSGISSKSPSLPPPTPPMRGHLPAQPTITSAAAKSLWFRNVLHRRVSIPLWLLMLLILGTLFLAREFFRMRKNPTADQLISVLQHQLEQIKALKEQSK